MTWEADLGSQIIAGVISAGLLATVLRGFEASASVRRNDALVRDFNDDLRRWIIDRDRRLKAAMTRHHKETPRVDRSSSAYWRGQAQFQAQALQDWRDEATRKRRDYARIVREEDGFAYGWARFNQSRSDCLRSTLATVSVASSIGGVQTSRPISLSWCTACATLRRTRPICSGSSAKAIPWAELT